MDKDDFKVLFSEDFVFEDAVRFFKGKIPITKAQFEQLRQDYKNLAFTVSGYSDISVINQFYNEVLKAIETGSTLEAFKVGINNFLLDKGYTGLSNHQADNIYRTNIQTASNAGHYKKMNDPGVKALRPYWQYVAVDDNCTRDTHRAMNGLVFSADDPIWDTWYPPNGYRCRCTVRSLSKRQVEAKGLEVSEGDLSIVPDKGFNINPAKQQFQPDISGYPESLQRAYKQKYQNKS